MSTSSGLPDRPSAVRRGLPGDASPSADGSRSLACAVIVKRVDARADAQTSINDLLRA